VNVRAEAEVLEAFDEIMSEVDQEGDTVLVQEMVKGPRELVAGLTRY